jgi:hypothetical protein
MADKDERGIHEQRLLLGEAALLSPTKAAALMPIRDGEAMALLRREGLIRCRGGHEVVRWGDVVAFFRSDPAPANSTPPPTHIKPLPRADLRPKR